MMKIKKNQFACNFLHHQLWPAPAKTLCEYYRFISLFFFLQTSFREVCSGTASSSSAWNFLAVTVTAEAPLQAWLSSTWHGGDGRRPTATRHIFIWHVRKEPTASCHMKGKKKCSLAANLKWAPTGSPEKPVWLYSSCSKPARESRSQRSVLTDLAKNKKYRNVSPETKSNSGKKERQQSERQPWCSTNSANYTGLDSVHHTAYGLRLNCLYLQPPRPVWNHVVPQQPESLPLFILLMCVSAIKTCSQC